MSPAPAFTHPVTLLRGGARSPLVLLCEHASAAMPEEFEHLGLAPAERLKHIAWDPGAWAVAQAISEALQAPLIGSNYSRLLVDCNRHPGAPDAMATRSEHIDVPGNLGLTPTQRQARIEDLHTPFHACVEAQLGRPGVAALVSVHSFTPVFQGLQRPMRAGLLADGDGRLVEAMQARAPRAWGAPVPINQPYDASGGVAYSIQRHVKPRGMLHAILELRQDTIDTEARQAQAGREWADCLRGALLSLGLKAEA